MEKTGKVREAIPRRPRERAAKMMKMKRSLNLNQLPARKVTQTMDSTVGLRMTARIRERVTPMG
jgi:hypothetical protein